MIANVTLYQPKGKSHIRYINKMARNIWKDYGYRGEEWPSCIKRALKKHVTYLRSLDRLSEDSDLDKTWFKKNGVWIKL